MIPVAVGVPGQTEIEITMRTEKWAFGEILGSPRR
jgi:hypothetical protein